MKKIIKKAVTKTFPGIQEERTRLRRIEEHVRTLSDKVDSLHDKVSHHDARLDNLKDLLGKVEPYQPLYGLGGLISEPRRTSADRCRVIEKALGDVSGLRMLDIGSSLGYVSYYFADRGASVEGWDSTLNNVEVSRLTGELNGIQGASFKFKELNEEMVKTIPGGEFDVVFVLSVFHHIIYYQGLDKTKELVKSLLDRIPVMVVELAKKGEDASLKWDSAQPENELDIFDGLDVEIKKLGDFHNHLSDNTRPLYMVTRKKEVEVNGHKYAFETSTQHAYEDSKVAQMGVKRRYYFGLDTFVKEYSFDKGSKVENVPQMMSEIALLLSLQKSKQSVHNLPQILDFEFTGKNAKLAMKKIEGKLGSEYGKVTKTQLQFVLKDVLQTLSDLEDRHIHHNDIRSWNIMIGHNQAWLIDYGLASPVEIEDNKVSFLWALQAIMSGEREDQSQHKTKAPKRDTFEKMAIGKIYDLALKSDASFRELLKAV